jgi:tRNA/tmRNA/rRNA uracil-C5-methylase (TrmA/RlmC/RlmD family)
MYDPGSTEMLRRVTIEKLAPTGEGVSRDEHGVGFVTRALPGEQIDAAVTEERRRFWRGRTTLVLRASEARVRGAHAGCAGCDWGHFELAAARQAKRELFLETMSRIGKLPAETFGQAPLEVVPSPPRYRLRNRFHVSLSAGEARIGYFAPRSHEVKSAASCEAPGELLRACLPALEEAIARAGAPVAEIATIENREGVERLASFALGPGKTGDLAGLARGVGLVLAGWRVVGADGTVLDSHGQSRVTFRIGGRELLGDVSTFFQGNRFLLDTLVEDVRSLAGGVEGPALDAYGGVGLFAGALLDAGLDPVTVEENAGAVALAKDARRRAQAEDRWEIVRSDVARFLGSSDRRFAVSVADPPRGGIGPEIARQLAARTSHRIVMISCDPATLARDLPVFLSAGWRIVRAKLYDLFPFTHRVESIVSLEPRP